MPDKKRRGVFGRSLKLVGMASQLAAKEVTEKFLKGSEFQARIEQAKIMTDALAELKGAAMKAGQLLSLEAGELLPKEATDILSKLQASAEPHSFEEMKSILHRDLGKNIEDLKYLTEEPIAAASIGQVHKAKLHGDPVAVKIQYPGIRESIDTDLKILRRVGESIATVSGKNVSLKQLFRELKEVLEKETDYLHEAKNMQEYGDKLKSNSNYIAPAPYTDYCTQNVLVMSWVDGISIREWIQKNQSQDERDRMAHLILDLFCLEFSKWGLVQTDPNFANFLVSPDNKLVCLDFGATLPYSLEYRQGYAEVLQSFSSGLTDEVFKSAVKFDLLSPKEPREVQIAFKEMIQVALEPFNPSKQPFDFQNKDFEKRTKEVNLRFSRLLKYSSPPQKILFLHRKLGGIFNLVKLMGIKMNLMPYWDIMINPKDG